MDKPDKCGMAKPSEAWLCRPRRNANRESRVYYCQNWRGDVVALLGASAGDFGVIRERVTYSAYGMPQGLPPGDLDNDADTDAADETLWNTLSSGAYNVRADLDLDGDMDITDEGLLTGAVNQGFAIGRGVLSRDNGLAYAVGNHKGYAGYEHDGVFNTMCHVRNRVLLTELGRWSRRDPLGYVDGMGLYEYAMDSPVLNTDCMGLQSQEPTGRIRTEGPNDVPEDPDKRGGNGEDRRVCLGTVCVSTGECSRFANVFNCETMQCSWFAGGCIAADETAARRQMADFCRDGEMVLPAFTCTAIEKGVYTQQNVFGPRVLRTHEIKNLRCGRILTCTGIDQNLAVQYGHCVPDP